MLNYIRADVKRILGRKSHMFTMLFLFAVFFAALVLPNRGMQVTSVSLIAAACSLLDWMPIFFGLFELIAVFSEDFKVKTMQVAIGLGISRLQVIVCKLLEMVILIVLDCIVLLLLILGAGYGLGVSIPMVVLRDAVLALVVKLILGVTAYTSLTMIVLFFTQSTILSIFVYILVSIGIVSILLSGAPLLGLHWVESLRLNRFMLSTIINTFYTRLVLGTFDAVALLGIFAYIGAGVFFTHKLFSKCELDF